MTTTLVVPDPLFTREEEVAMTGFLGGYAASPASVRVGSPPVRHLVRRTSDHALRCATLRHRGVRPPGRGQRPTSRDHRGTTRNDRRVLPLRPRRRSRRDLTRGTRPTTLPRLRIPRDQSRSQRGGCDARRRRARQRTARRTHQVCSHSMACTSPKRRERTSKRSVSNAAIAP